MFVEYLSELRQLWIDHRLTIASFTIPIVVVLMIGLGGGGCGGLNIDVPETKLARFQNRDFYHF